MKRFEKLEFGPLTPAAFHAGILLCLEENAESIDFPHEITEKDFSVIFNKFSRKLEELEPNFSEENLYCALFAGDGPVLEFATNPEEKKALLEQGHEELHYVLQFSEDFMKMYVTIKVEEESSTPMLFSRLRSGTYLGEKVFAFDSELPFLIFGKFFLWRYVKKSGIADSLIKSTLFSISE